jgi:hypothetical protein
MTMAAERAEIAQQYEMPNSEVTDTTESHGAIQYLLRFS